jgi:hypothetical protein
MSDSINYRPNGTVTVTLFSKAHNLRVPTIGEMMELEALRENQQDDLVALSKTIQGLMPDVDDEGNVDDMSPEAEAELRAMNREVRRMQAYHARDFLMAAMGMLGGTLGNEIDPDSLPSWATNMKLPLDMMTHWREVPLAHGGA